MILLYYSSCPNTAVEQHAAGRALLALACAEAGFPADIAPAIQPGGKPFLPGAPDFHFSIAHSGTHAVCAVGDAPLGADVEQERPLRRDLRGKICTPQEQSVLSSPSEPAFFDLWVGKEAAVKCDGHGLRLGAQTIKVGFSPDAAIIVGGAPCRLRRFRQGSLHYAVCRRGSEPFALNMIECVFINGIAVRKDSSLRAE